MYITIPSTVLPDLKLLMYSWFSWFFSCTTVLQLYYTIKFFELRAMFCASSASQRWSITTFLQIRKVTKVNSSCLKWFRLANWQMALTGMVGSGRSWKMLNIHIRCFQISYSTHRAYVLSTMWISSLGVHLTHWNVKVM